MRNMIFLDFTYRANIHCMFLCLITILLIIISVTQGAVIVPNHNAKKSVLFVAPVSSKLQYVVMGMNIAI